MTAKLQPDRLRLAREAKGWTWSDLAYAMGIEVSTPPRWERGQANPGLKALHKLAKVLEVEVEYLIGENDDSNLAR